MLFILHNYILHFILIKKCKRRLVILRHCQWHITALFKSQPEDSFMKAETFCCYVLLINYILCNNVVLENKIIYFLLIGRGYFQVLIWSSFGQKKRNMKLERGTLRQKS